MLKEDVIRLIKETDSIIKSIISTIILLITCLIIFLIEYFNIF